LPITEANGVDLYYELTGDRGDPIVLIHGSWTDHSNWNPVVAGLSGNFRVLTYDRRGGMEGAGRPALREAARRTPWM
jgi:pimeloyl-ACP methyl ester carboxylesterase